MRHLSSQVVYQPLSDTLVAIVRDGRLGVKSSLAEGHYSRTPACTNAITARGVRKVVVAIVDPDPRNDGAGILQLKSAGVEVSIGVLADETHADLDPYLKLPSKKAPG